MERQELFKNKWQHISENSPKPKRLNKVTRLQFQEFADIVLNRDFSEAEKLIEEVYEGNALILEDALSKQEIDRLKSLALEFGASQQAKRLKIVDDCPDWHEINKVENIPSGGYTTVDHSYYFFRWNKSGTEIFQILNSKWRVGKVFNGFEPCAFEANHPKHVLVDRVQMIHYPRGGGLISPHTDPDHCMRSNLGFYLSTIQQDYKTGGFYIIDKNGEQHLVETSARAGCLLTWYASLPHGVQPVEADEEIDWSPNTGRWFIAANTVEAHTVKNRHYALPYLS